MSIQARFNLIHDKKWAVHSASIILGPWWFTFYQTPDIPELLIEGKEREYLSSFMKGLAYNPSVFTEQDIDVFANHAYEDKVEVKSDDPQRKYHKILELSPEADIETARCAYNNGILEITFNKKEQAKTKGKTIKIE